VRERERASERDFDLKTFSFFLSFFLSFFRLFSFLSSKFVKTKKITKKISNSKFLSFCLFFSTPNERGSASVLRDASLGRERGTLQEGREQRQRLGERDASVVVLCHRRRR